MAEVTNGGSEPELIAAARRASHIIDPARRMDLLGDAAVRFSERAIEAVGEHALARFSVFSRAKFAKYETLR